MANISGTTAQQTQEIANNPYLSGLAFPYFSDFEKWSSTDLTYTLNVRNRNPDDTSTGVWLDPLTEAIEQAQSDISAVSMLTFTEIEDDNPFGTDGADIDYWYYRDRDDGLAGYSYGAGGPGVFINQEYVYSERYGDVNGFAYGGVNYFTVIHELMHNLGAAHTHDGYESLPGVLDYYFTGDFALNQALYTVLSYNSEYQFDDLGNPTTGFATLPSNADHSYSVLGTFDIAFLQVLYGANMSHATGDDIYEIPSNGGLGDYFKAIWDAGGIDTFVFSGTGDAIIDLRAATLDPVDGMLAGGALSRGWNFDGGRTIAKGTVIENATSAAGNDVLRGNDADNVLTAGAGNDDLFGGAGMDTLDGGQGDDYFQASSGGDMYSGGAGIDSIDFWRSDAAVQVDLAAGTGTGGLAAGDRYSGLEDVSGSAFDDVLSGNSAQNHLFGDLGNDTLIGQDGADTLDGSDGDDMLSGGDGRDTFYMSGGNDTVDGGLCADLAVFFGVIASFHVIDHLRGNWEVVDLLSGEIDVLTSIETLEFSDTFLVPSV